LASRVRYRLLLVVLGFAGWCAAWGVSALRAQGAGMFHGSADDPAIAYSTAPVDNVVADLNKKLQDGTANLAFEGRSGYLRSALEALDLQTDSQVLVFSPTSLQRRSISEGNPRALFFNDRVVLGWIRGAALIEVAAHDTSSGVVFYTLEQRADASGRPQFKRAFECLGCHLAGDTLGVPGLFMFSTTRPEDGRASGVPSLMDQTTPLQKRFGGWFVTGSTGTAAHMGNNAALLDGRASRALTSVDGLFDPEGYRALSSDVASLLVFSHQTRMVNLLTRASWEARAVDPSLHSPFAAATPQQTALIGAMMSGIAAEVVDYMLFVDEAKLADRVRGSSGFTDRFSSIGPFDHKGRSLHQLDLTKRLMKYPCSYLIYSPAFDALPPSAKDPIYRRLWQVLSGAERDTRYRSALSLADRQAIVEILRDTKKDLPAYFRAEVR
jgi:hypothetical protein